MRFENLTVWDIGDSSNNIQTYEEIKPFFY